MKEQFLITLIMWAPSIQIKSVQVRYGIIILQRIDVLSYRFVVSNVGSLFESTPRNWRAQDFRQPDNYLSNV